MKPKKILSTVYILCKKYHSWVNENYVYFSQTKSKFSPEKNISYCFCLFIIKVHSSKISIVSNHCLPSIHCGESIKVPLFKGIFGFNLHSVVPFCNHKFPDMFSVFAQNEILYLMQMVDMLHTELKQYYAFIVLNSIYCIYPLKIHHIVFILYILWIFKITY